jgi:hypothetical protein
MMAAIARHCVFTFDRDEKGQLSVPEIHLKRRSPSMRLFQMHHLTGLS